MTLPPGPDRESWQRDFEQLMRDDPGGAADALLVLWPDVEADTEMVDMLRANTEALLRNGSDAIWAEGLHPVVFRAGNSLSHQGLLPAATTFWESLLPVASGRLGSDHADTLTITNNLLWAYGRGGDPDRALTGFRDLLALRVRVLGPDHENTLATRHAVATWQDATGDHPGAAAAMRSLVSDYERTLGPDHRDTLNTRIALVEILGPADPAAAVAELRPLLDDFRRVLGADHPEVLEVEVELASWLAEAGDFDEALSRVDRLLDDYDRVLGPAHHDTLTLRFLAADMRARAGRQREATEAMHSLHGDVVGLINQGRREVEDLRTSIESWS
ncbi:tetratricopeptide repeat protein [Actinoplanes sp. CA-142083]|uniref:tetratricopeptide repeat protein n=1 Tax=Actinoplanes sp. CA-142083 TaxID=3239903 RepID=UPI003D8CDD72